MTNMKLFMMLSFMLVSTILFSNVTEASTQPVKEIELVEGLEVVKTLKVSASAYTANCKGCSGITKTGINLKKNPDLKVIAVDPNVIKLGTKVWVEGYGVAVAGDIGSAIKGNKIDVFMKNHGGAINWGRKNVTIKILK